MSFRACARAATLARAMTATKLSNLTRVAALAALLLGACQTPDYGRPLPPGAPALLPLGKGEIRPRFAETWYERDELLPALELSLEWFARPSSQEHFPCEGITHERARASLVRFKELLLSARDGDEFDSRVTQEFQIFKSAGWNAKGGGVLFTGYCTPILDGSLSADATYRHPLYALPPDLAKGKNGEILGQKQADGTVAPYPTRAAIEASGMLKGKGLELVYLRDPLDAFIAHVNGSAVIRLPDGTEKRFGYHGKNGREYRSLGKALVRDKHIAAKDISLAAIRAWGEKNPDLLQKYIEEDESFVFFLPIDGPPKGSLNVDVTGGRTLATDKSLFPRGGLVYVDVKAPTSGKSIYVYDRMMLDQDTGGAIRTAGRADIYIGVGDEAEQIAGGTKHPGQMYYLFLKSDADAARGR